MFDLNIVGVNNKKKNLKWTNLKIHDLYDSK